MFARLGVTPSRWRAFGFGRAPFLLIAPRTIAKPLTQAIKLDHRTHSSRAHCAMTSSSPHVVERASFLSIPRKRDSSSRSLGSLTCSIDPHRISILLMSPPPPA